MNLSLNNEQLDKLLSYAFVGYQVIAGNKDLREEDTLEEEQFINYLYAQAYNAGSELVEQYGKDFIPVEEFEEELLDELEEYEEDMTFENLAEWLALRDMQEEYHEDEIEDMDEDEFEEILAEYSDAYAEEFADYGVENLYLDEEE